MVQVHLINMDKHTDRLERVQKRFTEYGYQMIRVPGVDVSKTDVSMYHTGSATKGTIGCTTTHLKILEEFVKSCSDQEYIVIGEDDVIFLRKASELEPFMKNVPKDFDIVHLGCELDCVPNASWLHKILGRLLAMTRYESPSCVNGSEGVVRMTTFVGTHLYAASRKGARKILQDIGNDRSQHIDYRISQVPGLVIYSASRPFATTEPTGLCTDSAVVGGVYPTWLTKLFCWMDHIKITESRSLGYVFFLKWEVVPISFFDVILCLLFGWVLFKLYKFKRSGTKRST